MIAVLLLGLLAGGVSCAAVQGGLLAGLVGRQRAAAAATVGDDLAPVGGFLAGKLVSHAFLGLLLGGIGSVVQLSLHARTLTQLVAGALIVVLGLAQLGVPGLRRVAFEPPASWGRFVRGRARGMSTFSPALLGLASVLIPCGVTLSVMALAVTTGSPWQGAALMALFVIGTAPLFAVLGYAAARARRAAGPWRRRLATLTGLAVLAAGLFTVNGGLELAGSPVAASQIAELWSAEEPAPARPPSIVNGNQQVFVTATTDAYLPGDQVVLAGIQTTLIVRSQEATGCIREFVIPSLGVEKVLPRWGDTALGIGPLKPGKLRFSCGMGMYTGMLTVVERAP